MTFPSGGGGGSADQDGESALALASRCHHHHMVQNLLDKCQNLEPDDKREALLAAIMHLRFVYFVAATDQLYTHQE